MGHSLASAILGLVGQPKLQKYVKGELGQYGVGGSTANLISSSIVSPIYVVVTNPLSRLEVIMQVRGLGLHEEGSHIHLCIALVMNDVSNTSEYSHPDSFFPILLLVLAISYQFPLLRRKNLLSSTVSHS